MRAAPEQQEARGMTEEQYEQPSPRGKKFELMVLALLEVGEA